MLKTESVLDFYQSPQKGITTQKCSPFKQECIKTKAETSFFSLPRESEFKFKSTFIFFTVFISLPPLFFSFFNNWLSLECLAIKHNQALQTRNQTYFTAIIQSKRKHQEKQPPRHLRQEHSSESMTVKLTVNTGMGCAEAQGVCPWPSG